MLQVGNPSKNMLHVTLKSHDITDLVVFILSKPMYLKCLFLCYSVKILWTSIRVNIYHRGKIYFILEVYKQLVLRQLYRPVLVHGIELGGLGEEPHLRKL